MYQKQICTIRIFLLFSNIIIVTFPNKTHMKPNLKIVYILIFSLLSSSVIFSQNLSPEETKIVTEAIELMEKGNISESILLLEKAQKTYPEQFIFPYEKAFAYYLKKDYSTTIDILEKLKKHKDANDLLYQMLGNAYDMNKNTEKAVITYNEGLKLFPNSGKLYLELGIIHMNKEEYGTALENFEKGIQVEPNFPSNYYWAARLFLTSEDEVWGMLYGELFMNLERNTQRTIEMSFMLYSVYKDEIKIINDTAYTISFSKNHYITPENKGKNLSPFGSTIYETDLGVSILNQKTIDIHSLNIIRTKFIQTYYQMNHHKNYPNVLFDYQKSIYDAGHLEAYNYWILMKGDEDGFQQWQSENKEKWEKFVDWFTENKLSISPENVLISFQY